MTFTTSGYQKKIPKPWGQEIIFTPENLKRAGKILSVKAGHKLSLQYHETKEETLCLLSGEAIVWVENDKAEIEHISMQPQQGYTIVPKQRHRIEAVRDCVLLEVSSPELGTTVRLEDDYNRPDETEELRRDAGRGWHE